MALPPDIVSLLQKVALVTVLAFALWLVFGIFSQLLSILSKCSKLLKLTTLLVIAMAFLVNLARQSGSLSPEALAALDIIDLKTRAF